MWRVKNHIESVSKKVKIHVINDFYFLIFCFLVINVNIKLQSKDVWRSIWIMESAQEEVKFPCSQCKKKNKQKRSLKTHIDSAHENIMYASIKLPKKEKRRNWYILKRSMRKSIILVISNQQSTSTQSSCRDRFGGFSFFPREDFANTLLHRDLQQPLLPHTQLMLRRLRRGRGIFSIFTLNLDLCHKYITDKSKQAYWIYIYKNDMFSFNYWHFKVSWQEV